MKHTHGLSTSPNTSQSIYLTKAMREAGFEEILKPYVLSKIYYQESWSVGRSIRLLVSAALSSCLKELQDGPKVMNTLSFGWTVTSIVCQSDGENDIMLSIVGEPVK